MTARQWLCIVALLLAWLVMPPLAHACDTPESPATFVIHHETYGNIGTHVLTFTCEGEDLIVATEVDVKVKVLFVTAFQREARYREVWRGDRLMAYEARTKEGGAVYETHARVEDGRMIVDGVDKAVAVPLDTVSSHPWNVDVVERPLIFGQRDGRLHRVSVERAAPEILTIGGRQIEAEKYVVHGDLERELFYDADGTWLQWRLERDGKTITVTRQ
ncbi:MAG: hypothetical protein HC871_17720 [Rhizobiales bacterium]|nr:hypothetical protein [Hyphomicrobiales bacterium]